MLPHNLVGRPPSREQPRPVGAQDDTVGGDETARDVAVLEERLDTSGVVRLERSAIGASPVFGGGPSREPP